MRAIASGGGSAAKGFLRVVELLPPRHKKYIVADGTCFSAENAPRYILYNQGLPLGLLLELTMEGRHEKCNEVTGIRACGLPEQRKMVVPLLKQ